MHHSILASSSDPFATSNNPVIRLALIFIAVGGALAVTVNLRNARLWLLLLRGKAAEGRVTSVDLQSGSNGKFLRKPVVAFTPGGGETVHASPVVYRKKCAPEGALVRVRYAADDPSRVVVRGFDFRVREVLSIGAGLATVVAATYLSFTL